MERGSVAAHSRTSVEALAFDSPGRRLASSSAHGDVCLWAITEEGDVLPLYSEAYSQIAGQAPSTIFGLPGSQIGTRVLEDCSSVTTILSYMFSVSKRAICEHTF